MMRQRVCIGLVTAAVVWGAALCRADEVTFTGGTLQGKVLAVSSGGIDFQPVTSDDPEYPASKVVIPYASITAIRTDDELHVLHGDDNETVGRIVGIDQDVLLVGREPATAVRVDTATIRFALTSAAYDGSWLARTRSQFRYWKAGADLGFSLTRSTVDTTGFGVALRAERQKAPTRLRLEAAYRLATQEEEGAEKKTIQDEITGLARGDYAFTDRVFGFASGDAKYDGIQRLSVRGVPKLGVGYFLWKTKHTRLSVESGGAYIYERYFGGDTNAFFAVAFGGELETALPYGAMFRWRADYLPAIEDWSNDYLVRNDLALVFPMSGFLAFKASLVDDYDNTPASGAKQNSLTTLVGISVTF